MRNRESIAGVVVLLVLRATAAWAQELTFRVANDTEFNSNYLARENDPEVSFTNRIGPRVTLRDPYGRLTYSLDYTGQFGWYLEPWDSRLNAWDHSLIASGSYAISPRTQFSLHETFRDQASVRFGSDETEDLTDTLDAGQDRFKRNTLGYRLEHGFTSRLSGVVTGQHDWVDFDVDINRSDSVSMGLQGQLVYALTRADRVGGGVGFAYQSFDEAVSTPSSRGKIWNAFVSWSRRFGGDLNISMSGGPTFIASTSSTDVAVTNVGFRLDPNATSIADLQFREIAAPPCNDLMLGLGLRESTCGFSPTNPPGAPTLVGVSLPFVEGEDTQDDLTFFARVNITKTWIDWEFSALYSRSQSAAAGDAGTSTLDRVLIRVRYEPNRTWGLYGTLGWNRRDRAARPIGVEDFIVTDDGSGFAQRVAVVGARGSRRLNSDQLTTVLGITRDFSRRMNGNFEFRYRYQFRRRRNQNFGSDVAVNIFILNLRLNYSLDPIRI